MPSSWTTKEERQYEHIRDSAKRSGKSTKRAKQIAARTVNKKRRQLGKTANRRTQGTGNPNKGLAARTRDELYNLAKHRKIKGRSTMSKAQLIKALS